MGRVLAFMLVQEDDRLNAADNANYIEQGKCKGKL